MKIIGNTDRMDVILDTESMEITILQKWKYLFYSFLVEQCSEDLQRLVKRDAKNLIYSVWNDKAYAIVNTQKGSIFNENFGGKPFKIKVRIETVSCGEHWQVEFYLNPTERTIVRSEVIWDEKIVVLNDYDFYNVPGIYFYIQDGRVCAQTDIQCHVSHEFGHTLGNIANTKQEHMKQFYSGDEYTIVPRMYAYPSRSRRLHCLNQHIYFNNKALSGDINSIMNIGNELRHRHFAYLRDILQEMIPGSYFAINIS